MLQSLEALKIEMTQLIAAGEQRTIQQAKERAEPLCAEAVHRAEILAKEQAEKAVEGVLNRLLVVENRTAMMLGLKRKDDA